MPRISPAAAAAAGAAVTSAALWFAGIGLPLAPRPDLADLVLAGALLVVAAVCWLWRYNDRRFRRLNALRDRDRAEFNAREAALIKTLDHVAGRRTGPMPRLRSVGD